MDRWTGKVAVVTGASSGIGKSIAEKLVEHGLLVAGLARRVERVEQHAKSLSGPGKLHAIKCDVSCEEDVKKAFLWVQQNLGPVSILVNNAGVVKNETFIDGNPSTWKQVLDINLLGLAMCTQQAVQQMRVAGIAGHIININSVAGHQVINNTEVNMGFNMYASSKFGVTAYTEVMRQEMRNNELKIKITSISPGIVDTDIFDVAEFPTSEYIKKNEIPALAAEDIADAVIYALGTKPHVQIHEMIIKPLGEAF